MVNLDHDNLIEIKIFRAISKINDVSALSNLGSKPNRISKIAQNCQQDN